jgi:hypothetical protein
VSGPDLAYLVFGGALVVALVGIGAYTYSRRRKQDVERAKFRMMDDDE